MKSGCGVEEGSSRQVHELLDDRRYLPPLCGSTHRFHSLPARALVARLTATAVCASLTPRVGTAALSQLFAALDASYMAVAAQLESSLRARQYVPFG
jgi:hypothetical protein